MNGLMTNSRKNARNATTGSLKSFSPARTADEKKFSRTLTLEDYYCFKKSVANSDVNAFVIWYVYCYNRNESEAFEAKDLIIQEAFNFEFRRESNKPEHKVLIISLFDYLVNNVFDSKSIPSECELKIIQNVRDWVFDDMYFFYDWWCLRNGKNKSSVLWLSDEK